MTEKERLIIQSILKRYLPEKTSVWVFGSRAQGPARRFSDLDLLLDHPGKPLPTAIWALMANTFDESPLPYSVDLIDSNTSSEHFKQQLQKVEFAF